MTERLTPDQLKAELAKQAKKGSSRKGPKRTNHEHIDQSAYFDWRNKNLKKYPLMSSIHSNPNGGHRHWKVAADMKDEGSTPGLLDIAWPLPRGTYFGFYWELKSRYPDGTHNRPSPAQKEWIKYLEQCNYLVGWSVGWQDMAKATQEYYDLGPCSHLDLEIEPLKVIRKDPYDIKISR